MPAQDWQRANLRRAATPLDKPGGVAADDWQALETAYLDRIASAVQEHSA